MRRMDYSSFNVLPKQKINSYHIKMEDECSIGNDETRIFILSNLASNKMNKVPCVLCKQYLTVFDRYPLIDGTFFLSPRQHNRTCVQVIFSKIRPNFCRPITAMLNSHNLKKKMAFNLILDQPKRH